jgi:hypothetical protein
LRRANLRRKWSTIPKASGRTIWITDAHGYGKRFVVRADEMLTTFLELQRAIHGFAVTVSQESVFNDCKAGFANGEVHRI